MNMKTSFQIMPIGGMHQFGGRCVGNKILKRSFFSLCAMVLCGTLLLASCATADPSVERGADGGDKQPAESSTPSATSGSAADADVDAGADAGALEASDDAPDPESEAADWIESQLAEQDNILYVYKDASDGLNHFTQKSFMGDNYDNIPAMDEGAEGYSGPSGIAATLNLSDHLWGGYMFLNGALAAGETEPAAGGDKGLDLTGALKLVFYAKGETGKESVEFFTGGYGWEDGFRVEEHVDSTSKVSLGTVELTKEWTSYEIDLSGCDLSDIQCGFGWMADSADNPGIQKVSFSLDDIRFEFADGKRAPTFLQSYASVEPGTDDAIINNFAYLYDNAAASLALSYAGKHDRARQLADAIVYVYGHDRFYSDGRLRNAYANGSPFSFPGWQSVKKEEFGRMPGFYDTGKKEWYEDFHTVSTSTGNLAWAVLALCEVAESAPEPGEYLETARGIGDFILTLRSDTGGFTGGYEGWEPDPVKVTYKSTEHNIDLISVFGKLADLTGDGKYKDASVHAKEFVMSVYDADRGCFYTGTSDDGVTTSEDVLPLDCNTWAILALGDDFKDAAKVLEFVEQNMAVDGGYDFNTDKDGVWFEGTAQVALAYKQAGNEGKYQEIVEYLNLHAEPDGSITAADRDGVTTGFLVSGTDLPWKYGKRVHCGATAWLAFAQLGVNPFA
jgi:hypothetical protein